MLRELIVRRIKDPDMSCMPWSKVHFVSMDSCSIVHAINGIGDRNILYCVAIGVEDHDIVFIERGKIHHRSYRGSRSIRYATTHIDGKSAEMVGAGIEDSNIGLIVR